jgi:hypothetical protein
MSESKEDDPTMASRGNNAQSECHRALYSTSVTYRLQELCLTVLLFQENKSFGASTICIHPLMYGKLCREHSYYSLVWPTHPSGRTLQCGQPSGIYPSEWHSTMESIKFPVSARCCLLSDYHSKSCLRGVLRPRPPIYLGTFSPASWKIINISIQSNLYLKRF